MPLRLQYMGNPIYRELSCVMLYVRQNDIVRTVHPLEPDLFPCATASLLGDIGSPLEHLPFALIQLNDDFVTTENTLGSS